MIVCTFIGLASLYSFVIPLGEGPDEPGHASYVFFLARTGRLPDQRANEVPGEGHQPPLAYLLAAPLLAWLPADQRGFDLPGNARFTWAAPSLDAAPREVNAVAHGSREYWPWRGAVLAWHLARLVSVALGAATVGLTYLAARALVGERRTTEDEGQAALVLRPSSFVPLLAAALVALNPQFLFVSALITNDALLTALSAALLWLVVRGARREASGEARETIWQMLAIGVVLGLALISKQSAIVLAPIALLSVVARSWAAARVWRDSGKRDFLSSGHLVILSQVTLMIVVTLLICGWWYLRNRQLYGDLFGLAVFQSEFSTGAFDARSPAAWLGALAQLHASFWARFGWMNVPAPGWAIVFFTAVELAALIGWVRYLDERRTTEDERARFGLSSFVIRLVRLWPILALPLLAFGWVLSFALTAGLVAWQGRLLFPALPAIAIVLAMGLSQWKIANRRWGTIAYSVLPLALAALAAWLPFGVIRPAYPFHTLPEQVALGRIGTPVYGRLGLVGDPGAELLGWQPSGTPQAGSTLALRLIWHALGRQNRNWTVFVHLVGADDQIVDQADAEPQAGAFPMKQWVAGDWVEDEHMLALPARLPPGTYTLRVGLYYPRTGRRAAVFDQKGKLAGDSVDLGPIVIK